MAKRNCIKRNKNNLLEIILIIIILILLIFLVINLRDYYSILDKKQFQARVIVSDHYGFEINSSALMFGMVTPGGVSSKSIDLENNYGQSVNVQIYSKGEVRGFLLISENNFILEENQKKKIGFSVSVPEDYEFGEYSGEIEIIIRKI